MPVFISLLRGINVGGHNKIKMDTLRELYLGLGFLDPRTYVQSGNVVFRGERLDVKRQRIEDAIERRCGFRPGVVLRTTAELRETLARNPFAKRRNINPAKLLVTFLAEAPSQEALAVLRNIKAEPEEVHVVGQELFIYFSDGLGRSKFPWASLDKVLKTTATGRNWNTVTKLLAMAEELEAADNASTGA